MPGRFLGVVMTVIGLLAGCGNNGGRSPAAGACDGVACDSDCQQKGYQGGLCEAKECRCIGGDDASVDSGADADGDADGDGDGGGFSKTPGTKADVDRTAPCGPNDIVRVAPEDGITTQVCVGGVSVWAPILCGYPQLPDCTGCSNSLCIITGEVAQLVGGKSCVCLNPCIQQQQNARCGASNVRACLPIDAADGKQVYVCGGEM